MALLIHALKTKSMSQLIKIVLSIHNINEKNDIYPSHIYFNFCFRSIIVMIIYFC